MIVLGIDPGLQGAVARLAGDTARVWDLPICERKTGRKTRKGKPKVARRVDAPLLAKLLDHALDGRPPSEAMAFVEQAQSAPRMGKSSAFNYGVGYGVILGALAHLGVQVQTVRSHLWKKGLGLARAGHRELGRNEEQDKGEALELARRLYPELAIELEREKDNGRAEALLVAHFGSEQLGL